MPIDPKKDVNPLVTTDWTRTDTSKAFFQKAVYTHPLAGITKGTQNPTTHTHEYRVDEDGNGWALEAIHPTHPQIHHKHKITNWVVEESQSSCYPTCEQEFGAEGSPPHTHLLNKRRRILKYPARYSIAVETDAYTTDNSDARLAELKELAKPIGAANLLEFYNKLDRDPPISAFAEDWYLSERPLSKIKILISIPSAAFDALLAKPPPEVLPTPWTEIYLNTLDLETKIEGVTNLLKKYNADIQMFYGKVTGLDLGYQSDLMSNTITALAGLMATNGADFSSDRSDLLIFGIDENYKFLYGQYAQASNCDGPSMKSLYVDFNKFKNSASMANARTVNLLSHLDTIYEIYNKNDKISWSEFFEKYILNPPDIDFSALPAKSCPPSKNTQEIVDTANRKKVMTWEEFDEQEREVKTTKADLKRKLDTAAEFVGDTMVGGLDQAVGWLSDVGSYQNALKGNRLEDGLFKEILNKIPVQNLIAAAMECLGFQGFDFLNLSKQFLNQSSGFLEDVAKLFDIPALNFPDDFPVADYMKDLGEKIAEGIVQAAISILIDAILAIIEQLLDLCAECAMMNEADGKSRLGGLNFGAMSLLKVSGETLTAGVISGLTKEVSHRTGYAQMASQVMSETEAWAAKPALLGERLTTGDLDAEGIREGNAEAKKKLIQQHVENSKAELGSFLKASETVLTPGEMGNLLLGCGAGKQPLEALSNLVKSFPTIDAVIGDDPVPKLKAVFENLGKLFGPTPILEAVADATDKIPEQLKCLCDEDDRALRTQLLSGKGLTPPQVEEQIKKSRERKHKRLKELSNLLDKDNILEGTEPAIYCTMVYRDSDGREVASCDVIQNPIDQKYYSKKTGAMVFKGVKEGLIKNDHENFTFALDQTLDTIYGALHMAFNSDIVGYVPLLTKDTYTTRTIPRTKMMMTSKGAELMLNPEWRNLVKDPNSAFSFGSLPGDASKFGGSNIKDDGEWQGTENIIRMDDKLDWGSPKTILEIMTDGQMSTGQSEPTGLQEKTWELAQPGHYLTAGGRKRPDEYPDSDSGDRMAEYTRMYGYSPIPVTKKERGEKVFAPGLKNTFYEMCDINAGHFQVFDDATRVHRYSFDIPVNIFEAAGVDITSVMTALDSTPGNVNNPAVGATASISEEQFTAGIEMVKQGFSFLNNSSYQFDYYVPYDVPEIDGWVTDRYGVTLTMKESAFTGGSLILYKGTETHALRQPIIDIMGRRQLNQNYDLAAAYIPQEKLFVSLNEQIWDNGTTIYRNGTLLDVGDLPPYARGLDISPGLSNQLKAYMLGDISNTAGSTYDGLWHDFYCSLTKQISESPFMELKGLSQLNMTPMNELGQTSGCENPSLLDVETIKKRVKEEYGLIQCIEASFPNEDGKGTNADNPFEKANLGGAVLLTVRTYVLEILLRSIGAFYYFRYKDIESIDTLLISYISTLIKQDVTRRQFIDEFKREALKLYNRNASNRQEDETTDFDFVLDYFVRRQIFGVSNRLAKTVGSIGDTDLDSCLTRLPDGWMPSYPIQKHIGEWRFKPGEAPQSQNNSQVPVDAALQLFGDGVYSARTIRDFEPYKLKYNKTLRTLMQKYIGSLRGVDYLREKSTLGESGFLNTTPNAIQFTQSGIFATNDIWAESARPLAWSAVHGISDAEMNAMAILMKMLASAIPKSEWKDKDDPNSDYQQIIEPYTWNDHYDPTLQETKSHIYPGHWLRHVSRTWNLNPRPGQTLRYNSTVWDRRPWSTTQFPLGTGEEVNSWIRDLATTDYDVTWNGNATTISQPPHYSMPNASTRNNAYESDQSTTYSSVSSRPTTIDEHDREYLRWVNVPMSDGTVVAVGPWKRFTEMNQPQDTERLGFYKWKLIDPRYNYSAGGQRQQMLDVPRSLQTSTDRRSDAHCDDPAKKFLFAWCLGLPGHQPLVIPPGTYMPNTLASIGINYTYSADGFPQRLHQESQLPYGEGYLNVIEQHMTTAYNKLNTNRLGKDGYWLAEEQYYSLLDFNLDAIPQILRWEKANAVSHQAGRETSFNDKYDQWIREAEEAISFLEQAHEQRMAKQAEMFQLLRTYGVQARENLYNPGLSWDKGNIITEYYLRVEEHPYQGMPESDTQYTKGGPTVNTVIIQPISGYESERAILEIGSDEAQRFRLPIEKAKWKNSNYVDLEGRTEFLKGVVNIEKFQEYIDSRFPNGIPDASDPCPPELLTKALIQNTVQYAECGEKMAAELGIRLRDASDFVLGDFFKSVHVGIRISYVAPITEGWVNPTDFSGQESPTFSLQAPSRFHTAGDCFRYHPQDPGFLARTPQSITLNPRVWTPTTPVFQEIIDDSVVNGGDLYLSKFGKSAMYDKAYGVKESNPDERGLRGGVFYTSTRWVHVVPIVSSEIEIDPFTPMTRIADRANNSSADYTIQTWEVPAGSSPGTWPQLTGKSVGFFEAMYTHDRQSLINQLQETQEYKLLFKYFFPLDRMLALNNMYASSYLSTFKGINDLLDGTKTNLKRLFFALQGSGNVEDTECGPDNLGLQLASLNGLDIEGLITQLALMIVKTALLIFKGFVEVSEPNIAISKAIIDGIHMANKLIAMGAVMANQAQQMGAAAGQAATDIGNIGKACPEPPGKPPDAWFDPIDENFIPEPNIVWISLALLPLTFLPLFWPGWPLHIVYGPMYWALDWKPEVNWLQSMPPADWLDELLNKDTDTQALQTTAECDIDTGLPALSPGPDNGDD